MNINSMNNPVTSINSITNITGFIDNIQIVYDALGNQSGAFSFIFNTIIDNNFNAGKFAINKSYLILNDWNLTAPSSNANDQLLILGSDSSGKSYIYLPDINFKQFPLLSSTFSSTMSLQLKLYILLYFFKEYGIGSYKQFAAINSWIGAYPDIFIKDSGVLSGQGDPDFDIIVNYDRNSKLPAHHAEYFYTLCNRNKPYSSGNEPFFRKYNLKESDWQYAANYYNSIIKLAKYNASNFCIQNTGTANTPSVSLSSDIYKIDCSNNKTNKPIVTLPAAASQPEEEEEEEDQSPDNSPDNLPNNSPDNNSSFIILVAGGLICMCILLVAGGAFLVYMKSTKNKKHGGYFYLD